MYNDDEIATFGFNYSDITYAIFDNPGFPDRTISFLCKIPSATSDGGVVYSVNLYLGKRKEVLFQDNRKMNGCYYISKRKILNKEGVIMGYEGRVLNDYRWS